MGMKLDSPVLETLLRKKRLDGILFFSLENIRYLCGFTGSDGALWLNREGSVFLSDSRYEEQARGELNGAGFRKYRRKIDGVAQFLRSLSTRRLGFESSAVSFEGYRRLKEKMPRTDFIPLSREMQGLRACKRPDELAKIRQAVQIASKAFEDTEARFKSGAEERAVANHLEWRMKRRGGEGFSFPTIVASGERAALPHGSASVKRMQRGDTVVVDFGVRFQGYHSDETKTLILGKPDREQRRMYDTVRMAQERALRVIRPGVSVREIDGAARRVIQRAGYGPCFGHGTGHGVGLAIHEEPSISPQGAGVVEEGMVFTVEPGIYVPGRGGVRLEDMVRVTSRGIERLTRLSKELKDNIRPG